MSEGNSWEHFLIDYSKILQQKNPIKNNFLN